MKYFLLAIILCAAGCSTTQQNRVISRTDLTGNWEGYGYPERYIRLDIRPDAESFAYEIYGDGQPEYYKIDWLDRADCGNDRGTRFMLIPISNGLHFCCSIESSDYNSHQMTMGFPDGHVSFQVWPVTDQHYEHRSEAEFHLKKMGVEQSGPAYPPQGVGSADP